MSLNCHILINKLLTPVLHYKTPFKILHNTLPNYILKAFGCLCYVSIHDNDKFAPRAIKSLFLGYPFHQKGYKLLNLENYSVFVSRHVTFQEHIFSYLTSKSSHLSHYSFLDWYSSNTISLFVNSSTSIPTGIPTSISSGVSADSSILQTQTVMDSGIHQDQCTTEISSHCPDNRLPAT